MEVLTVMARNLLGVMACRRRDTQLINANLLLLLGFVQLLSTHSCDITP